MSSERQSRERSTTIIKEEPVPKPQQKEQQSSEEEETLVVPQAAAAVVPVSVPKPIRRPLGAIPIYPRMRRTSRSRLIYLSDYTPTPWYVSILRNYACFNYVRILKD
jgi:hypothetical protein